MEKNHESRKRSLSKESQVLGFYQTVILWQLRHLQLHQSDLGNLHHSLQNDQGDKDKSHENHPQKNISAIIVRTHATSVFIWIINKISF